MINVAFGLGMVLSLLAAYMVFTRWGDRYAAGQSDIPMGILRLVVGVVAFYLPTAATSKTLEQVYAAAAAFTGAGWIFYLLGGGASLILGYFTLRSTETVSQHLHLQALKDEHPEDEQR